MRINYKKLNEFAKEPTSGSKYAAGIDLYAATDEPLLVLPRSTAKVSTGIAVDLPLGTFGAIFARSGIAPKRGLRPANCVGVIDADYRGPVIVAIHNDTDQIQTIEPQERIAQLVVIPYFQIDLNEVDTLSETVRGTAGFGDSGRF